MDYDESTGILTIDVGLGLNGTETVKYVGVDNTGIQYSNGYFTFNASKSPSLVSIPNLQQRVAYLSDVKPSGTAGGTATAGVYQTRTLNTLVDNTGFVASLASNQFTLPAGTYDIYATAPASCCNSHKIKLRNTTDSSDSLMGSVAYFNASSGFYGQTDSVIRGTISISNQKTFEIQHRVETTRNTDGLGGGTSFGDNNVFTQVAITKIK